MYLTLKLIHILSATILFGTGLGTAFFKWRADRSGNVASIAHTNRVVVWADWIFTTPTIVIQPLTGMFLMQQLSMTTFPPWLVAALCLYGLAGLCWIPVVALQIRMRQVSALAMAATEPLPKQYWRDARCWFYLGIPAFSAMVAIYVLMMFKPSWT